RQNKSIMKNQNFVLIWCFFLFTLLSCNKSGVFDEPDIAEPGPRTYENVQEDFENIDFKTGHNDVQLENLENDIWKFRVVMPDVDFTNNNKRPLIITLHGCASCGISPDSHKFTECLAEVGFESLDAIILSPNSNGKLWPTIENNEQVKTLVDLASTFLPVDTNKIVIHGYSDGGNGSWFFAETQSNIFSASIPMASQYNTTNSGVGRQIPIPVYVIHGQEDALFPVENVENWVNASIDSGSDITMVIAPDLTHNEPCEYAFYLQDAADWLVNHVWN
uniref:dienelactone hydrolase family protein n=1 Tax=uncultured Wocania sp. TaxID=2834404 RepID=UPI0030FA972B